MPIYEYRRPDGTTFEVMQGFSDEPLTSDPDTGVPVERVLHAPAVHFKGKGFYNTDYGTRKRQRETASSSESTPSTTTSEKGATDSAGDSAANKSSEGSSSSSSPDKKDASAKAQTVAAASAG